MNLRCSGKGSVKENVSIRICNFAKTFCVLRKEPIFIPIRLEYLFYPFKICRATFELHIFITYNTIYLQYNIAHNIGHAYSIHILTVHMLQQTCTIINPNEIFYYKIFVRQSIIQECIE